MFLSSLTFLATFLLTAITTSSPINRLEKRAGGPLAKPIPAECSLTNPLANLSSTSWQPKLTTRTDRIYYYYLPLSTLEYTNRTDMWTMCLQQCYGYGYTGDCKAAFMAENVPSEPMYTAPGGAPSVACLMYKRQLTADDFMPTPLPGKYVNAEVGNIGCPS